MSPRTLASVLAFGVVCALAPVVAVAPAAGAPLLPKPSGVLSPRLDALADGATVATSDAGEARLAEVPVNGPGSLLRRPDGALTVNARLTSVDAPTEDRLVGAGAVVLARSAADRLVTLAVDGTDLVAVAAVAGVEWIEEVLEPQVHRTSRDELREALEAGGVTTNATCSTRIVSEADGQLGAATARSTYGVDGTGVRVGILSDSYDNLAGAAAEVAAGELPGPGNPCGRTTPVAIQSELSSGGSDEGRAMAQAVHDLAPGAALSFATAFVSDVDFANQIRGLAAAGAKVIVDDISYFNEPIYQDGIIAKAIADVTAAGVTYFSSAGNSNLLLGGREVASYEAMAFRPAPCPASVAAQANTDCHDLDPGAGVDVGDGFTLSSGGYLRIKLGWSQPQYGITTDLDLFLVDTVTGAVVASALVENLAGSRQAYEYLTYTNTTGSTRTFDLVVARYGANGTPRFKRIVLDEDGLSDVEHDVASSTDVIGPSGYGHNMSRAAGSIAAIRYNASTAPEAFSARGPATYCWGPVVGTSAAAPLASCVADHLDVTATNGAANSFFGSPSGGVWRFYGTSQAAPHAAAVAALQVEAQPCRTPEQILDAQRSSAQPIGSYGQRAVGSGLLHAPGAVAALAPCIVLAVPGAPSGVSAVAGNGVATVSWSGPTVDGGSAVTGYVVTPFVGGVAQAPRSFASTATSQVVSGLANGTAYAFSVAATNAVGTGEPSGLSAAVTPVAPATVPGAPSGVSAVAGNGVATVSWSGPTVDGGSAVTGYVVTPFVGGVAQAPRSFASTATSQVVSGLANGTAYAFSVAATNAVGTGEPSGLSAAVTPRAPFAPFASWGAMVDRLALDLLGRAPTGPERTSWISRLSTGTTTPGQLVAEVRAGKEHTTNVDTVARLYRAYFLRSPDRGGFDYWLRQRRVNERKLALISSTFAGSSEFRNRYGTLSNRAFVELVYRNVLGREGDPGGITYWTGRLDARRTVRGQVMLNFSESSEYRTREAATIEASVQHLLLLGRVPATSELEAVVADLASGDLTPAELAGRILAGEAYAARVGG